MLKKTIMFKYSNTQDRYGKGGALPEFLSEI